MRTHEVMGGAHNRGHAKDARGARASVSLRPALAVIASLAVVVLVVYAIFHAYSNALSDEFYDLASDSMNDYTAAQKVEVESFISEVSSTISTMRVLAESPDVDLTGSAFTSYLEEWNEQGSFQITYAPIEALEAGVEGNPNERDANTLDRLKAAETVVSDVRKSSRLNGYYFSIAEPIESDGRVVGALRSIVKAEKLLETSQLSSQVMLLGTLLIKEDGTIVSVSSRYEEDEGRSLYDLLESKNIFFRPDCRHPLDYRD